MAALAEYVDFSPLTAAPSTSAGPESAVTTLRKGMTIEEVEQLLGPAQTAQTDDASGLEIMTRTYGLPENRVVARFASGLLVDFAITPR